MMETKKTALVNGRIFNGDTIFLDHALVMQGDRIHGIFPEYALPENVDRVDMHQANVCAGLIDLQIYGTGKDLFSADLTVECIRRIEKSLLAQGCTSFMLTLATNTLSIFKEGIRAFQEAQPRASLGLHLEGPFLNPAKRGAHPAELILNPTPDHIYDLFSEDSGTVKMMTVAPEIMDDVCIRLLLERGILLSAGHSAASFRQGMQGFSKGIRAATHLWNAMSPLHHRDTGLPGAIFADHNVAVSIIVDGIHVDYEAVKFSKRMLGRRLFLITDAVGACDNGIYQHVFKEDHYVLPDGTLSGSALTLLQAIENSVTKVGIPLDEAIRMATLYPAQVIGRTDIGHLGRDAVANVLVFDEDFQVKTVYFEGEQVV